MSERTESALERIANAMEAQEKRLAEMEEERGPTFMDFLASGAEVNRAAVRSWDASAEAHEVATAESRDRMEMIESFKVKEDK